MAEVIRMPRMSDTMEEGNIVEWLKKVGDSVEPGDVLAEVETDKATMELESYQEGVLLYIGVESGPVPVNGILAVIGEEGEDYEAALSAAKSKSADAEEEKSEEKEDTSEDEAISTSSSEASTGSTEGKGESSSDDSRVKASPLARSMAKEANISLTNIQGSGENNRIVKKDIEDYISSGGAKAPSSSASSTSIEVPAPVGLADFQYGDHPVSQMRKVIAKRLAESKFSAPHFYLTIEIDMDNAIKARKEINENSDTRISFNDFVVKACAMALRKHPAINASWLGDKIRYNKEINIGVAVAVKDGLLVPVIKNADFKQMSAINVEVREKAGRAKDKKLQPDEMQGNTFTISNLGMFDIEEFTAIINPPDSCILAVGSIRQKPIVKNGAVVPGNIMKVTLSCDHRVVDGASGAEFLATLKAYLENPVRMLV